MMTPKPQCTAYFDGASVVVCGYRYRAGRGYYEDERYRAFAATEKDAMHAFVVEILSSPVEIDHESAPAVDALVTFKKRLGVKSAKEGVARYRAATLSVDGDALLAYSTRRESARKGGWFFKPTPLRCDSWRESARAADFLFEALAACE